ncbi:MAG: acyl-CoA dehydrogenase family protein [Sporichthyaceae bacterium]
MSELSVEDFGAQARAFLDAHATPRAAARTTEPDDRVGLFRGSSAEEAEVAKAWQRQVFDAGFAWITGPEADGGRGLTKAHERAWRQLERRYDLPGKAPLSVSLGMVAPTVDTFAQAETRAHWLPKIHRGEVVGCQLFSEPGAGSDLASVRTAAVKDGENWVLNGQKVWTTGAHFSDIGLALCRTSPEPRHQNLTMFLVDLHAPGVEVRPLRQITGSADFNEVFLTDVVVSDADRIGEVGAGWKVALAMLGFERDAIGGGGTGGSGIFRMDDLARWLHDIGRADDPAVAQAFAKVYSGIVAAKAMRRRAEETVRAGGVPGPEMSLAKLALSANLMALSDLVTLALGPRMLADTGETRTFAWAEYVLSVPGMRIGGGTDEIQRNVIAERVLGLPKER